MTTHTKQWIIAAFLFFTTSIASATLPQCQAVVKKASVDLKQALIDQNINLKNNPEAVHKLVAGFVQEHLDFKRIGRVILGEHWSPLSDEQKERFITAFQSRFIRAYAQGVLSKT